MKNQMFILSKIIDTPQTITREGKKLKTTKVTDTGKKDENGNTLLRQYDIKYADKDKKLK
ncbi:MAG: hypothetical protein MZU97_06175 [Bacillus subtilis]|nr:hypothetical protein [Bacillus subtilis]